MSDVLSVEERLRELERQVARLNAQRIAGSRPDWTTRVIGSFADRPEFDEVLRHGREFRSEQNAIEVNPQDED